jgi:lincosamide nucleotidyltransferase A/C/D/E
VDAREVLEVLDALEHAGARAWVGGGWGVDALVGRRTRDHRDLDLAVAAEDEDAVLAALAPLGFAVETDWRPVRVELRAPGGRWVDLHPVVFDAIGHGRQAGLDGVVFDYPAGCLATGRVGGRAVACLDVDQQLRFHAGYAHRDVDRHDVALLRELLAARRPPVPAPPGVPRVRAGEHQRTDGGDEDEEPT